jgi:hypothetical protein
MRRERIECPDARQTTARCSIAVSGDSCFARLVFERRIG